MNRLTIFALKALRKLYTKGFNVKAMAKPICDQNADSVSQKIYEALMDDKPCMISRFGANELLCLVTYLGVKENNRNIISYITGKSEAWWWNKTNLDNMVNVAGFFPPIADKFEQFCNLMLNDITEVDILGSWLTDEQIFENELIFAKKIRLLLLDPYWSNLPWTKALEGNKVLVVHPFAKTIEQQYKKRELLFKNNLLPKFELKTIKAVQSLAGEKTPYIDWFEALKYMKSEIDKADYDICLIGAGAYGFPLAAHVKRKGKKAVHLGGSLQLLFGIRGKRWEDINYNSEYNYAALMNEYWVKPCKEDKPYRAQVVEGGCYW